MKWHYEQPWLEDPIDLFADQFDKEFEERFGRIPTDSEFDRAVKMAEEELLDVSEIVRNMYADAEWEVVNEIKKNGGANIWWFTENQMRAEAADRLESEGAIVRKQSQFPFVKYELKEE